MNKYKTLITTLIIATMTSTTAFAGWVQSPNAPQVNGLNSGWWFSNTDGSYYSNTWKWIDGNNDGTAECYLFNAEGWMYSNCVTPDNYTVNENGAWTVNGTVQTQPVIKKTTTSAHIGGGSGGSGGGSGSGSSSHSSSHSSNSSTTNKVPVTNPVIEDKGSLVTYTNLDFDINKVGLTDNEMELYNICKDAVENGNYRIYVSNVASDSDADYYFEDYSYDLYTNMTFKISDYCDKIGCPRIFIITSSGFGGFTLNPNFLEEMNYTDEFALNAVIDAGITEDMTQVEAVKIINDYICENVDYDHAFMEVKSAKEALESGKAICGGYSCLFTTLCAACGIDAEYVPGTANGGLHAWNRTTIDGVTTYTDTTWNDVLGNKYLMISFDQMEKDHKMDFSLIKGDR